MFIPCYPQIKTLDKKGRLEPVAEGPFRALDSVLSSHCEELAEETSVTGGWAGAPNTQGVTGGPAAGPYPAPHHAVPDAQEG